MMLSILKYESQHYCWVPLYCSSLPAPHWPSISRPGGIGGRQISPGGPQSSTESNIWRFNLWFCGSALGSSKLLTWFVDFASLYRVIQSSARRRNRFRVPNTRTMNDNVSNVWTEVSEIQSICSRSRERVSYVQPLKRMYQVNRGSSRVGVTRITVAPIGLQCSSY